MARLKSSIEQKLQMTSEKPFQPNQFPETELHMCKAYISSSPTDDHYMVSMVKTPNKELSATYYHHYYDDLFLTSNSASLLKTDSSKV